jgi:outer membrane protein
VRDLLTGVGDPVPPVNTPPPSTVGYVDQAQIDALPAIKSASTDFAKFKATQDQQAGAKFKSAKTQADRDAIMKDYQKTLVDKQNQTIKPLVDKTRDAMSSVAQKRGLILVIDRGSVIYGGTDITADVTSALK